MSPRFDREHLSLHFSDFVRHVFAALLLVGCVVAGPASAQTEGGATIAMLPIVVHSADDPAFLQDGLADMLASRLEQAGGFQVIRIEDSRAMTTRLVRALEEGKKTGADFVLFGSFTRFGTGASLDMQCAAITGDTDRPPLREIFVHSGSVGDVIPDLDELVGKLRRFANLRTPVSIDVAAPPESAPSSPEIEELRRRVSALEAEMMTIQEQADTVTEGESDSAPDEAGQDDEGAEP